VSDDSIQQKVLTILWTAQSTTLPSASVNWRSPATSPFDVANW